MSKDEFGERAKEPDKHIRDKGTAKEKLMARLRRYAAAPPRPGASLSIMQKVAYRLFGPTPNDSDPNTRH